MTDETAIKVETLREATAVGESAGDLIVQAREFSVNSPEENAAAAELIRDLRKAKASVEEAFDPVCTAAHKAHRAATGARSKYLKPVEQAIVLVTAAMKSWKTEADRLAKVSRQKLIGTAERALERLEATPEEREAVLARVEELVDRGLDDDGEIADTVVVGVRKFRAAQKAHEEAAAAKAEEWDLVAAAGEIDAAEEAKPELDLTVSAEALQAAPTLAEGTHGRRLWSVEITNVVSLCEGVVAGVIPEGFVSPNLVEIRRGMHAVPQEERDAIEWPGIDVTSEEKVIVESDSS